METALMQELRELLTIPQGMRSGKVLRKRLAKKIGKKSEHLDRFVQDVQQSIEYGFTLEFVKDADALREAASIVESCQSDNASSYFYGELIANAVPEIQVAVLYTTVHFPIARVIVNTREKKYLQRYGRKHYVLEALLALLGFTEQEREEVNCFTPYFQVSAELLVKEKTYQEAYYTKTLKSETEVITVTHKNHSKQIEELQDALHQFPKRYNETLLKIINLQQEQKKFLRSCRILGVKPEDHNAVTRQYKKHYPVRYEAMERVTTERVIYLQTSFYDDIFRHFVYVPVKLEPGWYAMHIFTYAEPGFPSHYWELPQDSFPWEDE
jgi:hypothetical protein